MPAVAAAEFAPLSVDTSVVSRVIRQDFDDRDYSPLVAGRSLALTYFVQAELAAAEWSDLQRARLDRFIAACVLLGNPDAGTALSFVEALRARRALGFSRAERNRTDLWIIAQTAQHGLPLITDDARMVRVADVLGMEVLTLLPGISELLGADRRRLSGADS